MVKINENHVDIYKHTLIEDDDSDNTYEENPFMHIDAINIFIGASPKIPMTEYSGGFGDDFDGNTILLHINTNTYLFIGSEIFFFESFYPIKKYVSPVGNNDVPYPYAVDELNNYYLLIENVVMRDETRTLEDPYDVYYAKHLITADRGRVPPKDPEIKNFKDIKEYVINEDGNDERYTLTYTAFPQKNYERIKKTMAKCT